MRTQRFPHREVVGHLVRDEGSQVQIPPLRPTNPLQNRHKSNPGKLALTRRDSYRDKYSRAGPDKKNNSLLQNRCSGPGAFSAIADAQKAHEIRAFGDLRPARPKRTERHKTGTATAQRSAQSRAGPHHKKRAPAAFTCRRSDRRDQSRLRTPEVQSDVLANRTGSDHRQFIPALCPMFTVRGRR